MINKILRLLAKLFLGKGIDKKLPFLVNLYQRVCLLVAKDGFSLVDIPLSGKLYVALKDTGVGLYLLNKGKFEAQQTRLFLAKVKKGDTVLDIGANIGYYTVLASKLVGRGGKVYAFEPDRRNTSLLKKNLKLNNCSNVKVIAKAVVERTAKVGFKINPLSQGESRINKNSKKSVLGISLDDFIKQEKIKRVDVIKMDIEGAETFALMGGKKLFQNSKNVRMFLECNSNSLKDYDLTYKALLTALGNLGFKVLKIINEFKNSSRKFTGSRLGKILNTTSFVGLYAEKNKKGLDFDDNESVKPLISVIMTAFNAEKFVKKAVLSILGQTYKNFELLVVNDGSKDKTLKILKKLEDQDERIRIINSPKNIGPSYASNLALLQAKGKYICRMDADDIAFSDRLVKQLEFLQKNQDVVAVGGQCQLVDWKGNIIGSKNYPINNRDIYNSLYLFNPMQHPTLMINRNLLPKGLIFYKNGSVLAHDLELVFELAQYGKLANLKDDILFYRYHQNSLSLKNPKQTFKMTIIIRKKALTDYGYKPNIRGKLVNFSQRVMLSLLPEKYILPLFIILRGIKNLELSQKVRYIFENNALFTNIFSFKTR